MQFRSVQLFLAHYCFTAMFPLLVATDYAYKNDENENDLGTSCQWRVKASVRVPDTRRQHDQLVEELVDSVDNVLHAVRSIRHFTEYLPVPHQVKQI